MGAVLACAIPDAHGIIAAWSGFGSSSRYSVAVATLAACSGDCGRKQCREPGVYLAIGGLPTAASARICIDARCRDNAVIERPDLLESDPGYVRQVQMATTLPEGRTVRLSITLSDAAGATLTRRVELVGLSVPQRVRRLPGFPVRAPRRRASARRLMRAGIASTSHRSTRSAIAVIMATDVGFGEARCARPV